MRQHELDNERGIYMRFKVNGRDGFLARIVLDKMERRIEILERQKYVYEQETQKFDNANVSYGTPPLQDHEHETWDKYDQADGTVCAIPLGIICKRMGGPL